MEKQNKTTTQTHLVFHCFQLSELYAKITACGFGFMFFMRLVLPVFRRRQLHTCSRGRCSFHCADAACRALQPSGSRGIPSDASRLPKGLQKPRAAFGDFSSSSAPSPMCCYVPWGGRWGRGLQWQPQSPRGAGGWWGPAGSGDGTRASPQSCFRGCKSTAILSRLCNLRTGLLFCYQKQHYFILVAKILTDRVISITC